MSAFSFLNRHNPSENNMDFSWMRYDDLCRCFAANTWAQMSLTQRRDACQALENHFAAEQGRPSKLVILSHMEGSCYGCWSPGQDVIKLNESFIAEGTFTYGSLMSDPRPDANLQAFDTVAHEGYHAYQSYAIEHPEIHANKTQLQEWRENDAGLSRSETNYINFDQDSAGYRIQPLERDAFDYGETKTIEAFDSLTQTDGFQPGYAEYRQHCELHSYENALAAAQQENPHVLEDMRATMHENCVRWGFVREETQQAPFGQEPVGFSSEDPAINTQPESVAENVEGFYRAAEGFLDPDEDYAVKGLSLDGNGTVSRPSPRKQYEQRMADISAGMAPLYEDFQDHHGEWTAEQAQFYMDALQAQELQLRTEAYNTFVEQTGVTPEQAFPGQGQAAASEQTQGVSIEQAIPEHGQAAAPEQTQGASMEQAIPEHGQAAAPGQTQGASMEQAIPEQNKETAQKSDENIGREESVSNKEEEQKGYSY